VSVVIVSYNTLSQLERCLAAIEDHHERIVVDNGSGDGSAAMVRERFPDVVLIEAGRNLGFGMANNLGMDRATRELVLLLNSDCYAEPGAIDRLAAAFDDEKVVAAGGRLNHMDGSLQQSVARHLTLGHVFDEQVFAFKVCVFGRYWMPEQLPQDKVSVVPQVMGACLMLRPVERFDPRFFLYCEDTELCLRLERHGSIVYVPSAVFTHELGASSRKAPWRGIAFYNRGKELTFRIHQGAFAGFACLFLNRFGALIRVFVYGLLTLASLGTRRGWRDQVSTFGRVLFAPLDGPKVG
jgi:hypothetical protein